MTLEEQVFRSTVADFIDFEPEENPPWRTETSPATSTRKRIEEIVEKRQKWDSTRDTTCDGVIKRRLKAKFFYHCNVEEEHGLQSVDEIEKFLVRPEGVSKGNESLSFKEQETVNLIDAYSYLESEGKAEDMKHRGLLEESMLRQVNKIILRNITRKACYTKPGTYSNNPRVTQLRGETYYYQQPDDMQEAVSLLLDRYNSLFTDSVNKTDEVEKLQGIFKSVAWLVYELLDLHPFSDGNGRLCRLLCSYVLSTCTPFPSPIYNMYSESSKNDFVNALVDTRKSETKHPCKLTTMIIESNWASWKNLEENYYNSSKSRDQATDSSSEELQTSLEHSDSYTSILIASCA